MAYPRTRSLNAELIEGMTDGSYKKVITDRGGEVETGAWNLRKELGNRYGIHEAPTKVLPDGSGEVRTPYCIPTEGIEEIN